MLVEDTEETHRHRMMDRKPVPSPGLDYALLVFFCDCTEADIFTTCMARHSFLYGNILENNLRK